jgi:hypothetical protein
MYSAGVILFELWHPFSTAMERHLALTDLKQKGNTPVSWATQCPGQSILLRRLLCPSPSEHPFAVNLLQNELPHRMEDEWLNGKFFTSVHCRYDDCYYLIIVETEGWTILLVLFVELSVLCLYVLMSVHCTLLFDFLD